MFWGSKGFDPLFDLRKFLKLFLSQRSRSSYDPGRAPKSQKWIPLVQIKWIWNEFLRFYIDVCGSGGVGIILCLARQTLLLEITLL